MMLDKFSVGINPPEDIVVKAKLKESKSLTSVMLYKKITKIVEKKLSINIGPFKVLVKGKLFQDYNEKIVSEYMQNELLDISVDIGLGKKYFTAYTMDLTKKYIEINADYRS